MGVGIEPDLEHGAFNEIRVVNHGNSGHGVDRDLVGPARRCAQHMSKVAISHLESTLGAHRCVQHRRTADGKHRITRCASPDNVSLAPQSFESFAPNGAGDMAQPMGTPSAIEKDRDGDDGEIG